MDSERDRATQEEEDEEEEGLFKANAVRGRFIEEEGVFRESLEGVFIEPRSLAQIKQARQHSQSLRERHFCPCRSPVSRSADASHREPPCGLRSCAFST